MLLHGKFLKIELGAATEQALLVLKALGSEQRLRVLEYIGNRRCTVTEIAQGLNLPLSTTTAHINILQDAGLLHTELEAASRGLQKVCNRTYDQLLIDLSMPLEQQSKVVEVSMPVGHYSRCAATPTCGLAGMNGLIGMLDDLMAFYEPQRIEAQLIWFRSGFVEYLFPNHLPPRSLATSIQFSAEICSEAPLHNMDWPSDITLWINNHEIGTWICPSDFGGQRGSLTPLWWDSKDTQYGLLKRWQVTATGSFIDGVPLSNVKISDLHLRNNEPISVRLGIKADAKRQGGLNLFGAHFGNYPQDLGLRIEYEEIASQNGFYPAPVSAATDDISELEEVIARQIR